MALQFFFLNLFILSAGVILFLTVRAWPRLDGASVKKGPWEKWLASDLPERLDQVFHGVFLKMLRKIRVSALKIDNAVAAKLERMKLERGDSIKGHEKPDLASLAQERGKEEEPD